MCGATFPTATASLVDVTPPAECPRAFGLTSATLGLGFIVSPPVGGLLGEHNYRLPFVVAGISEERWRTFDQTRPNPSAPYGRSRAIRSSV